MKMANKVFLSGFLVLVSSCTGINFGRSVHAIGQTTPTDDYQAGWASSGKGGVLYHRNTVPGQIGGAGNGTKRGEACLHSILGLIAWGQAGITNAMGDGNIKQVQSVEHEHMAVLGVFYHRYCAIVLGE